MQPTSNPGNISLGQFSRDYDINKGTVSRKAKALGISTSEGLTPQAVDELKEAFGLNDLPAKPVEVEVYNSTETALAPIEPLPTRYDLAQFGSVPQASSALTQVNQALSIVDSLKAQMSLNTEAAYQQLEQSQQAAQQLARAQQELLLEAQKYSIEMNILGRLSAANNAQINSTMEAIQQLGKPQNVQ